VGGFILNLRESLVLTWSTSYIACCFLRPGIFGTSKTTGIAIMLPWGIAMIAGLLLSRRKGWVRSVGSTLLIATGLGEVFGGVASCVGAVSWHVGLGSGTLLQVSMATYDFVVAIVLLNLGTERLTPTSS